MSATIWKQIKHSIASIWDGIGPKGDIGPCMTLQQFDPQMWVKELSAPLCPAVVDHHRANNEYKKIKSSTGKRNHEKLNFFVRKITKI